MCQCVFIYQHTTVGISKSAHKRLTIRSTPPCSTADLQKSWCENEITLSSNGANVEAKEPGALTRATRIRVFASADPHRPSSPHCPSSSRWAVQCASAVLLEAVKRSHTFFRSDTQQQQQTAEQLTIAPIVRTDPRDRQIGASKWCAGPPVVSQGH